MTPEELSCFLYRLLLCTESPLRFSGVIAIHEIQTLHNVTWTELKAERINSGDKFASEKVFSFSFTSRGSQQLGPGLRLSSFYIEMRSMAGWSGQDLQIEMINDRTVNRSLDILTVPTASQPLLHRVVSHKKCGGQSVLHLLPLPQTAGQLH